MELVVYPDSGHGPEAESENFGKAPGMYRNLFNMIRGIFRRMKHISENQY